MEKQIHTIVRVFGFIYMSVMAVTIIQGIWSYAITGQASGSPEQRVTSIVDSLLSLPIKLVHFVFVLIGSIIENIIKLVLYTFGARKLAEKIKIEIPNPAQQ